MASNLAMIFSIVGLSLISSPLPVEAQTAASSAASQPTRRVSRADARRAADEVRRGNEHFQAGRFAEAARAYQTAFDLAHESGLLFNLGRALESAGDLQAALDTYQRFVDAGSPGVDPELVRIRIDGIRSRLAAQAASPDGSSHGSEPAGGSGSTPGGSASASNGATPPDANSNGASEPAATARPTEAPSESSASPRVPERVYEYRLSGAHSILPPTLLGLGVAAAGVSVLFGVLTLGPSNTIARVNSGEQPWSQDAAGALDAARTRSTIAWVTGIGGGVLITTSVLWFALRGRGDRIDVTPRVSATVLPLGAGGIVVVGGAL